jgi:SAM-dependent methyltransferase
MPAPVTELRACASCGLQYFAPSVAGDADFYTLLSEHGYYEESRWEFGVVASAIQPDDDVLDIGCGRGDFLRQIAGRPGRTVGADHNAAAIDRLQALGIEGYVGDVSDIAAGEPESFDVVCAFQVLEHLPTVASLLEPALGILKPGGRLYISVPNRNRWSRDAFEPFDHPPHHISRWSATQFHALAEVYGVAVAAIQYEEPAFSEAEEYWFERAQRRWGRLLGVRGGALAARASRRYITSPGRYDRAAAKHRFTRGGVFGHTMLAEVLAKNEIRVRLDRSLAR